MKNLLFGLLLFLANANAAKFCRSGATGNGSGSDWTNAVTTLSALNSALTRGEVGYVAKGTGPYAGTTFNKGASGTTPITIKRATAADHGSGNGWQDSFDGQVVVNAPLQFTSGYWVWDGVTWNGFKLNCNATAGGGGGGSVYITGSDVEIRHTHLYGTYSAGADMSLTTQGANTLVADCYFQGAPFEDHINIRGSNSGTHTIQGCRFTHVGHPNDGVHRDLMNPYGGNGGWGLVFKNNLVGGEMGDVLLLQTEKKLGAVLIEGNVFTASGRAAGFGSSGAGCTTWTSQNNVYWQVGGGEYSGSGRAPDTFIGRNNFYGGGSSAYGSPKYSMWASGTGGFVSGTGNVNNVSPAFINTSKIDGADGIPFTADDGFNITAGSPLRNAGTDVGRTVDLLGTPITAPPDVGAYEFATGAPTPTPAPTATPTPAPTPEGSWMTTTDGAWVTFAVPKQTGVVTWTFQASASAAGSDGVVGLASLPVTGYGDNAVLVRFNSVNNTIDAYNGASGEYEAVNSLTYSPGVVYNFSVAINVPAKTYSLTVDTTVIATDYGFRARATELDNVGVGPTEAGTFTVSAVNFNVPTPTPTPAPTATPTPAPTATPTPGVPPHTHTYDDIIGPKP